MAELNFGATAAGTAIAPGWGTLIGLGVDLLGYVTGSANEKKADALDNESLLIQAKGDVSSLTANVGLAKANIVATEGAITGYEQFLEAFPNYAEGQKSQYEADARKEFKGLLNNYAMGNAWAGATGRVGGSAGLLSAEDQFELVDYSGEDMNIKTDDGGRYQMFRDELYNNLTSQEQYAQTQLSVYQTTLPAINETLGLYETALTDAQNRVLTLEGKISDASTTSTDTGNAGGGPGGDREKGIVLPVTTPLDPEQRRRAEEELDPDLAYALATALAVPDDTAKRKTNKQPRERKDRDVNSGSQNNAGWNRNNR